MLPVERILIRIQSQLRNEDDAYDVVFEVTDITVLRSKVALGTIKLKYNNFLCKDFDTDLTIEEVHKKVKESDDLSYVLKYCMLRNKILEESIGCIFPNLIGDKHV